MIHFNNKRYLILVFSCLFTLLIVSSCSLVDPTEVKNPQTTEENLKAGATGGTVPFLHGVKEAFANAVEDVAYYTDVTSDNYDNISTYISPAADFPDDIVPYDLTLNGTGGPYFEVQELRALADFTITVVYPNDAAATADDLAQLLFYRGMANLISAEIFAGAPVLEDGPVLTEAQRLDLAIADFTLALSTSSNFNTRLNLALARAYRLDGDKTNAKARANLALGGSATFVFEAEYDAALNSNSGFVYAVERLGDDLQPLPRLDFLDPKYILRDTPINVLKMEEAHLILAEVELSSGNAAIAAGHLADAIELAQSRSKSAWIDPDGRPSRPESGTVKASAADPEIAGLVSARNGATVNVPLISDCSLDAAAVRLMTDVADLFEYIYLARQEIFFYEGRRMSDLGIRLCMMAREIETNDNISEGGFGTVTIVPSWIPASDGLDAFTMAGTVTTITYNMNAVLATNRSSASPFSGF
ncbi:hypothetical protein ACFL7D_05750 [candidate division KSB1 bacterium]